MKLEYERSASRREVAASRQRRVMEVRGGRLAGTSAAEIDLKLRLGGSSNTLNYLAGIC